MITNTARGFLPSHIEGLVITSTTRPYLVYFLFSTSNKYVINVSAKPEAAQVKYTKLIDHIFLFNGINNVSGYTIAPIRSENIIQLVIIFFVFPLLSIIIKVNRYPTYPFRKALKLVKRPSGSFVDNI